MIGGTDSCLSFFLSPVGTAAEFAIHSEGQKATFESGEPAVHAHGRWLQSGHQGLESQARPGSQGYCSIRTWSRGHRDPQPVLPRRGRGGRCWPQPSSVSPSMLSGTYPPHSRLMMCARSHLAGAATTLRRQVAATVRTDVLGHVLIPHYEYSSHKTSRLGCPM